MIEQLVSWEKDFFLFLNGINDPSDNYLDGVMYMISDKFPWIIVGVLYLFFMAYRQKWKEVVLVFVALALLITIGDQISSHLFKPMVQRFRPTHHPLTENLVHTVLGYRGGNYGFISGHATNFLSFVTFTSLLWRHRIYTISSFIVALTVCYSRIYLGVHFITDIIPGIIVGILVGLFVYYLYTFARVRLLNCSIDCKKVPYIHPKHNVWIFIYILWGLYFTVWCLSPLLFQYYKA